MEYDCDSRLESIEQLGLGGVQCSNVSNIHVIQIGFKTECLPKTVEFGRDFAYSCNVTNTANDLANNVVFAIKDPGGFYPKNATTMKLGDIPANETRQAGFSFYSKSFVSGSSQLKVEISYVDINGASKKFEDLHQIYVRHFPGDIYPELTI
jgi:hypothetical protein